MQTNNTSPHLHHTLESRGALEGGTSFILVLGIDKLWHDLLHKNDISKPSSYARAFKIHDDNNHCFYFFFKKKALSPPWISLELAHMCPA